MAATHHDDDLPALKGRLVHSSDREQYRHSTDSTVLNRCLDVVPWPVHHLDPDGRPYRPNPALAALLGYNVDELDVTTLSQCIPASTHQKLADLDALQRRSQSRNFIESSLTYRHRDGLEINARQSRVGPLHDPSTPLLVMLEGLMPSRRLDRDTVQSRFARLIAHDLNNVFTIAQSYVDLARRQSPGDASTSEYLSRAARSIERGVVVSKQLQTIALDKPFPIEKCSLHDTIESIQPFLGRMLPTGPKWSVHCQQSLPMVLSYPALLSRFVVDFSINAHLRWPHSPQLELEVRKSPSHRATIVLQITPPEDSSEALPLPFQLLLCRGDSFSPNQTDPLFISDILKDHPISLDITPHTMTALLPAVES